MWCLSKLKQRRRCRLNLSKETIGLISGILVVISVIPYALRTWQGKICPNVTSWGLWSVIGLALLLTYRSSGAEANVWPAVFGFTNPTLITILALIKRGEKTRFSRLEWACIAICVVSLGMWAIMRDDKSLAQYALYVAIIADSCAAIPTIAFVLKHPDQDRPFAWGLFAVAYILALFAVPDHTIANYVLPIYMFLGSGFITWQLARFRLKERIPATQWI